MKKVRKREVCYGAKKYNFNVKKRRIVKEERGNMNFMKREGKRWRNKGQKKK
jgi:hypothetical protein